MASIICFPRKDKIRHTVLVVDQESAVRDALCDALIESGFNALTVSSADEAARMLDRGILAIDLVFSDTPAPGILDSIAFATWVTENKAGLPFIMASDVSQPDIAAEIIRRPYEVPLAVRRIRATLDRFIKRTA
jgi:DNA-binding NtrC family response regulator